MSTSAASPSASAGRARGFAAVSLAILGTAGAAALTAMLGDRLPILSLLIVAVGIGIAALINSAPIATIAVVALIRAVAEAARETVIFHGFGTDVAPPDAINLAFLAGAGLWLLGRIKAGQNPWKLPLVRPAFFLLALAAISLTYTVDPALALRDVVKVTAVFAAYLVIITAHPSKKDLRVILGCIVASATLPILVGFYQFVNSIGHNFTIHGGLRIQSVFDHPNTFGFYLTAVLASVAGLRVDLEGPSRRLVDSVGVLAAISLLLTLSRTAWAATVIIVIVMAWRNKKLLGWLAVAGVATVLVMPRVLARVMDLFTKPPTGERNSAEIRFEIYDHALALWAKKPFTGWGWSSFQIIEYQAAHNDYLRALAELGIFGFLAFAALTLGLIRVSRRAAAGREDFPRIFLGLAIAYVVMSLVTNNLGKMAFQWYFWLLAGIMVVWNRADREGSVDPPDRELAGVG